LSVAVSRLNCLEEAVWIEPFPGAARSVICLTDHADWDSVAKSTALLELFARHEIRITKCVFPAADPGFSWYGPGLDDPEFAAVIRDWHETGHEIGYHGLSSSGSVSGLSLDECLRRMDRVLPFGPETWTDHGIGEHNFVNTGRLPGGADLLATLAGKGIRNIWSYGDAWQNPGTDLNIWQSRGMLDGFHDALRLAVRRGPMGPLQLAYLGTIPFKNLFGAEHYLRLFWRLWSPAAWRVAARNLRRFREISRYPLFLYGLSGDFFPQDPEEIMVFDTLLLNHLSLQFRPSNLDRLVGTGGIVIGHTYLSDVQRQGGRNCFRIGREAQILDEFRENIAYISSLQERGDVATLPLRDLRRAFMSYARARVTRLDGGWEIHRDAVVCSRSPFRIMDRDAARGRDGLFTASAAGGARLAFLA
jgi:hypothetical protein